MFESIALVSVIENAEGQRLTPEATMVLPPYHSAAVCGAVDVFREFDNLGTHVQDSDGLSVLHYAVKDIRPPQTVRKFLHIQKPFGGSSFWYEKRVLSLTP